MEQKLIALEDVISNPFRQEWISPMRPEKISSLVSSIQTHGWWKNVTVRKSEDKPGKFELGFGHHRRNALTPCGYASAEFMVDNLSDADMLRMMTTENYDQRDDVRTIAERVFCLVALGWDKGLIAAPALDARVRQSDIRYTPSFSRNKKPSHTNAVAYNVISIARYLGLTRPLADGGIEPVDALIAAVNLLACEEQGLMKIDDIGVNATVKEYLQTTKAKLSGVRERRSKRKLAAA
ncbi:MAG: ParB N-terminal domain-containing protein [Terriglobales bacterium]